MSAASSIDFKWIELRTENEILKQKNSILKNYFNEYKTKIDCLKSDYTFKEQRYKATIADLHQQIHNIQHTQVNGLNNQIKLLTKTNQQFLSEQDEYTNKINKLNCKISQQSQEINQLKLQNAATAGVLNDTHHTLNELNMNINDKNVIIDRLKQEIQLKTTFNRKKKSLINWNKTSTLRIISSVPMFSLSDQFTSGCSNISADLCDVSAEPILLKRNKSESSIYSSDMSIAQLVIIDYNSNRQLKKYTTNARRYSTIPDAENDKDDD